MKVESVPPSSSPTVVRFRSVVKTFDNGRVRAVDGVSFDVEQSQRLVLMGLSGSGKSTTLRLINGLATPDSGELNVLGEDVGGLGNRGLRHLRLRIGFIFQQFNLVGRLSAMENVLSGSLGRLRGPRYGVLSYKESDRFAALDELDRVGVAEQAFQRADTLSGGQRQRVAIARALFQRPDLILADEPVASLDPETAEQVMSLLFKICDEDGLTVITSLHQIELAVGWADRILGLRGGRVVLDRPANSLDRGTMREIYREIEPSNE